MPRSRLATTLVALPIIALLLGLGTWQLQRLTWKQDLIATMDARLRAAPQLLDQALAMPAGEREWRRVMAAGRFLHEHQVALYRMSLDGEPGYHLLVPLRLTDGRTMLVDRGFVPADLVEPEARPGSEPRGLVWVTGVLRPPETAASFTIANDPGSGAWYWIDLPALAGAMEIDLLPLVVHADAGAAGSWPKGGQAEFRPSNNHLQYALTWYGLAAVGLVIYVLLLRNRPSRGPAS